MACETKKNPISHLQEYCVKRNQQIPKYTIFPNGQSTFTCTVEVLQMHDNSDGSSKQEAKSKAAKKMLQRLLANDDKPAAAVPLTKSELIVGLTNNAINVLQEFCVKHKIPLPIYEDNGKSGADHVPIFSVKCILGNHCQFGTGKSKKIAKESAANKIVAMFEHLQINGSSNIISTDAANKIVPIFEHLQINNDSSNIMCADAISKETDEISTIGNPRGRLAELCVARKIMAPIIEVSSDQLNPAYFRATCCVQNKQTFGNAQSKKSAIQIACKKMFEKLEFQYDQEIKLNIKCIENEFPAPNDIIKVYKKHKINKNINTSQCLTEIRFSERHNYFQTLCKSRKNEILAIINSVNYTDGIKIDLIVNKTLNMTYDILPAKMNSKLSNQIFILNGDYDVAIMGNSCDLHKMVVNWFRDMI